MKSAPGKLFALGLLAFGPFASLACRRDPAPERAPTVGTESTPAVTAPEWTKVAVGLQSVLPLGTPCPSDAPPYRIIVEGDGEPLPLASGAPAAPGVFMACAPVSTRLSGHWVVSACADSQSPRKACLWLRQHDGAYYDREGKLWLLRLEHGPTPNEAGRVVGRFAAVAEFRDPTQAKVPMQSPTKTLTLDVDVGADVVLTALPGDYWGSGSGGP